MLSSGENRKRKEAPAESISSKKSKLNVVKYEKQRNPGFKILGAVYNSHWQP